ncbi:hypothetical protein NP233_g3135 [Leucocoprinus birnbaumii]|uniref:Uncharacterized protein n=1 Tax=Leucocoprinus birnbaumii TaxID=56174 RepID=A0AAD5W3I9_9AGAR|nr:hypothetical protein NP233_g3135 [Leucocoprinus birnbaumii]
MLFFSSKDKSPPKRQNMLELLPPEVCKQIYEKACDDDGRTGRSLSLVSRYVSEVSEEFKYRSLAVYSIPKILKCYKVLESKPPEARRIIHLFISAHEQVLPGEEGDVDSYQWATQTHYGYACNAFFGILQFAAPTVQTFYLCSSVARPTVLLSIPMPRLVEFTLFNGFPTVPTIAPPSVDFPRLKRIRFCGFTDHSKGTFHEIRTRAPNVTHLFFQSQRTADDLLEHIASVFGLDLPQNRPFAKFDDDFLDKIVEVRVEAPNKRKGFFSVAYQRMVKKIMRLEPRIQVTIVPTRDRVDSEYALIDWLRDSTREWNFPVPHSFI